MTNWDRPQRLTAAGGRVVFAPVRHHSPACSRALVTLIDRRRPAVVLVEGPPSFNDQIDLLLHPTARMPLAVYSHVSFIVDGAAAGDGNDGRPGGNGVGGAGDGPEPLRFRSYFPLCDYSPELVALREGRRLGADLGFIDLDYVDMARVEMARSLAARAAPSKPSPDPTEPAANPVNGPDESYYRFSRSLTETARRLGCRDHNELWDQMVEANPASPEQTFNAVLTYAAISRTDADAARLEADGTIARELAMAHHIVDRHRQRADGDGDGPVLVVTGAYHTVALPDLVDQILADRAESAGPVNPAATVDRAEPVQNHGHSLIRYGFERLEALSGYASGMPSPRWYQRQWEQSDDGHSDDGHSDDGHSDDGHSDDGHSDDGHSDDRRADHRRAGVATDFLTEIATDLREELGGGQPSLPTVIDAVAAARQLAALRGRGAPTRDDMVDAAVSCFTKGEDSALNPVRLAAARRLTGFELGQVPDGTPRSPLAVDFDRTLARLGVKIDTSEPRNLNLDVYRSARDRHRSRLLHGLDALGVSFGRCTTRLDFRRTTGRELIRERWTVALGPNTDSSLAEAGMWGASIDEAVAAKTRSELTRLLDEQPRSADLMRLAMTAARRGVHSVVADGLDELRSRVAIDSDLVSVVDAMSEAELLWRGREPLGGRSLDALPDLARQLYARACQLGGRLHEAPAEEQPDLVKALEALHQLLLAGTWDGIDDSLFWSMLAAERALVPPGQLRGAIAGLEWRGQRVDDDAIVELLRGHLDPGADPAVGAGFLNGLLTVAREVLWEIDAVIQALSELIEGMDQPGFIRRVPGLRSAFAALTPQETDRVAEAVRVHTGSSPNVQVIGVEHEAVLGHELISGAVSAQLTADGQGHWLAVRQQPDEAGVGS